MGGADVEGVREESAEGRGMVGIETAERRVSGDEEGEYRWCLFGFPMAWEAREPLLRGCGVVELVIN